MIKVICVGKIKNSNLKSLIDDYVSKINHYHKIEVIEVKDEPIANNEDSVLNLEANRVLDKIDNDEYVFLLDLHGKEIESVKFAEKIDKLFIDHSKICFVIGGSLGVGKSLIDRANFRLKLSDMTFLHQMTRLILVEQIFRAFKILNNETYHK